MKKQMKKLTLILFAILGVVFFNSCKDDTDNDSNNNTTTSIVKELKDYTGKTYANIQTTMQSKGYSLVSTQSFSGVNVYIFTNSDSSYNYSFGEYESKICLCSYENRNASKDNLLSKFEKYSSCVISYLGNTANVYAGEVEIENATENLNFTDRSSFLTSYNENKDSVIYCSENWSTTTALFASEFNWGNEEGNSSLIAYGDINLMPPFMTTEKSNSKSIFKILNNKK
jgi:hypothetical protein